MMPTLILIIGHPASGKSTIAQQLSHDLHIVRLSRDAFKETLFDSLGSPDLATAQRYGKASWVLMHMAAEALMEQSVSLIIDANYSPEPGRRELLALIARYQYRCLEILVHAPAAVLATRYQRRIQTGARHPGHHDAEQLMEQVQRMQTPYAPLEVGEPVFHVDTSQPTRTYYPDLVNDVRAELMRQDVS